jgi:hypothetical protein
MPTLVRFIVEKLQGRGTWVDAHVCNTNPLLRCALSKSIAGLLKGLDFFVLDRIGRTVDGASLVHA